MTDQTDHSSPDGVTVYQATPVVVRPAGQVLVEASDDELDGIVASISRAATVNRDAASTAASGGAG